MPRARDLLARFRPAGTPGAAGPAGVPADRLAELGRELRPVFDELAATEEEARAIRETARLEADRRRAAAAQRARAIVDDARRDADAQRADAAARVLREAGQEAATTLADARREADATARRAAGRYDAYVVRVLDALRPAGARP